PDRDRFRDAADARACDAVVGTGVFPVGARSAVPRHALHAEAGARAPAQAVAVLAVDQLRVGRTAATRSAVRLVSVAETVLDWHRPRRPHPRLQPLVERARWPGG